MFISCRRIPALAGLVLAALNAQAQMPVGASRPLEGTSLAAASAKGVTPSSLTIAYPQYLWPKVNGVATVYYLIDAQSDPNATPKIEAAIATYKADFQNVIQWVQWTSSDGPNYVDINLSASDTSGVCEANEGYEAIPMQPVTGSTDCTVGTILHEMGHVIGLWHEQSRSDRDTYISVNYNNVIKGSWSNFSVVTDDEQILAPYDYASVMQYIPYAFTRNGGAVIETIPAGIPLGGYEGVPAQAGVGAAPALPVFDYSAADKETILRLYGAAPTQVTVTSNPTGLSVIVDGVTITTPQSFAWPLYSSHTLDVPAGVQTLPGYILNSANPSTAATFYYTYGRWNDSTVQAHSITVTPGNGSATFPTTSPQVATYAANFIQLVPYSTTIYPADTGSVTVAPQPQTYLGVMGEYFVARQQATLTASAAAGWNFYAFINGPFYLQGGVGANPKTFDVPDSGDPVNTTVEFSNTPVYTVDAQPETFSSNLHAYVDSEFFYTPKNFSEFYDASWAAGKKHSVKVDAVEQPFSLNSRYNFSSWSDAGARSHSITVPATSASFIATVTPEFQPATNFNYPPCGGTAALTPASPTHDGFYPTGKSLTFSESPDTGWTFAGWTYDKTGLASPTHLTAADETLVFANFNTVASPLTLTSIKPSSARAGAAGFVLTLTGTGFSPTSNVSANGQYRSVTYVNSKTLTVQMSAADVANSGAFQVFVENFPAGWDGCKVFGYQTFLVQGKGPPTAPPAFSPAGGTYSAAQTVYISDAVAGATINYTTNGATPTSTSPVYSGPVTVSSSETLKASASASGYVRSTVAKATYSIDPPGPSH